MKLSIILPLLLLIHSCKAQVHTNEIIDPVSILPFEVTLKENYIDVSKTDSTISSGFIDITIQIDSIGTINNYIVKVVKINYHDKESKLFINGDPMISNDKIELLDKHLMQIDNFIKNNVTVTKRFSTTSNENYMKIPIKLK